MAQDEIIAMCADWNLAVWDELDWARIKDMSVREILEKRKVAAATAQRCLCLQCPDFVKHVSMA